MPIILNDDGTPLEVDARMFMLLLRKTWAMGASYALESVYHDDKVTIKRVNRSLRATWDNSVWLKKYITWLFKEVKQGKQPP